MKGPFVLLGADIRGCTVESRIEMKIPHLAQSAVSFLIAFDTDYAKRPLKRREINLSLEGNPEEPGSRHSKRMCKSQVIINKC